MKKSAWKICVMKAHFDVLEEYRALLQQEKASLPNVLEYYWVLPSFFFVVFLISWEKDLGVFHF